MVTTFNLYLSTETNSIIFTIPSSTFTRFIFSPYITLEMISNDVFYNKGMIPSDTYHFQFVPDQPFNRNQ